MRRLFRFHPEGASFMRQETAAEMTMKYILTGKEMAEADRLTSEKIGIPSIVLMERAALAVADEITKRYDSARRITVLAGPGNNGADGLAAGRLLIDRGLDVQFLLLTTKMPPEGSSMMIQRKILEAYGAKTSGFEDSKVEAFGPDVIIDALFGTGLGRPLTGPAAHMAVFTGQYRARTGCRVVGLDIPSGISSDDGKILGCAFECDLTVTFAYYKRGHFMFPGRDLCGETVLRQIGICDRSFSLGKSGIPETYMYELRDMPELLGKRAAGGNKGTFGKILIAAGSFSMCGAALLCAEACMRSGAGMVKIFTREENRTIVQQSLPEAMLTTYGAFNEDPERSASSSEESLREALTADLKWADVVIAGPAIGQGREGNCLLRTILQYASESMNANASGHRPLSGMVLDADALRLIAHTPELDKLLQARAGDTACILTPHLSEFADLVHVSVREAADDRIRLLREAALRYRCTVLGKDAVTMIASSDERQICMITNGNSGMATAGSGDVLAGITGAMLAAVPDKKGRGRKAADAAAFIHAQAGKLCMERMGVRAMIAGDILRAAGEVFQEIEDR